VGGGQTGEGGSRSLAGSRGPLLVSRAGECCARLPLPLGVASEIGACRLLALAVETGGAMARKPFVLYSSVYRDSRVVWLVHYASAANLKGRTICTLKY
jgi:hypothetical protein